MPHVPVLLKEVIKGLYLKKGDVVLDGTVGEGGHAKEMCRVVGKAGKVIGLDEDESAIKESQEKLASCSCIFFLFKENFRNLDSVLTELGLRELNGALFDIGLRVTQLEMSGRGFSYRRDEPLLMTWSADLSDGKLTAYEIVNRWSEGAIARILKEYGEERFAFQIARGIVRARETGTIHRTVDLVRIIQESTPLRYQQGKVHCARKTFQALRITVNDELNALKEGIEKALHFLTGGGRCAVISFHSLEDKIVKKFFKEKSAEKNFVLVTKRPIIPSEEEKALNPLSRSAKLRIIEKIN